MHVPGSWVDHPLQVVESHQWREVCWQEEGGRGGGVDGEGHRGEGVLAHPRTPSAGRMLQVAGCVILFPLL
jgi:hypothetical protein